MNFNDEAQWIARAKRDSDAFEVFIGSKAHLSVPFAAFFFSQFSNTLIERLLLRCITCFLLLTQPFSFFLPTL